MNTEDILKKTIIEAEKVRYACFSNSSADCIMYIKSNNELMMIHENRSIYRTFIPNYFDIHPDITYNHKYIEYNDKKEIVLDNLERLNLHDIGNLAYCKSKYDEYISDITLSTKEIIAQEQNLFNNESFQKVAGMKSGDGLQYFHIMGKNNTIISIPYFVGLYSIKKADKYDVVVYDFDRSHLLVKITDYKPRIGNIDIFICVLKGI